MTDLSIAELYALADIRAAIGDPYGKLMLSEVVDRIRHLARVEKAARKVCACKGRVNTQRAMCDLGDLLEIKLVKP